MRCIVCGVELLPGGAAGWHHPAGTCPPLPVCPECRAGKHRNCDGSAWSLQFDERVPCGCSDEVHA